MRLVDGIGQRDVRFEDDVVHPVTGAHDPAAAFGRDPRHRDRRVGGSLDHARVPAGGVERDLAQHAQHDDARGGSRSHTRQVRCRRHGDDERGGGEAPPAEIGVWRLFRQELT